MALSYLLKFIGLNDLADQYEKKKMMREVVQQICSKIDEATELIIDELSDKLYRQSFTRLTGKKNGLILNLKNY